jgi:hypothetical protein
MKQAAKLRWWIQVIPERRGSNASAVYEILRLEGNDKGWIFPVLGYPALLFYKSLIRLSCNTGGIYLATGIEDAPGKENSTRLNVANQEDEGAVYGDFSGH